MIITETKVLVVEDEPLIAEDLAMQLRELGLTDIKIALTYDDAVQIVSEEKFGLILLDINLGGEKDGIDLASFINEQCPSPLIFITSYYDSDTIERAKKVNPAAYILKPFNKQDILVNVEMVLAKSSLKPCTKPEKFFIKNKDGLVSIDPMNIDFVEAFDNYAKVFSGNNAYILSHTLKSVADKLQSYGFERVHKSYLINFSRISMISEGFIFFNDIKVPIGRSYRSDFMSKIAML